MVGWALLVGLIGALSGILGVGLSYIVISVASGAAIVLVCTLYIQPAEY
jgi:hypothetical protein